MSSSDKFDVFISFCGTEREWVKNQLRPWLAKNGLTTYDYLNNFLAGGLKARNMKEAVKASKKTLAVLSPAYLASNNCVYESELAVDKGVEERDSCLIPILRQECDFKAALEVTFDVTWLDFREGHIREESWDNLLRSLRSHRYQLATPDEAKDAAGRVTSTITTLSDSIRECPEMRTIVRDVEGEFSAVDQQLREIEFYKRIHNQLHDIDLHCLRMLSRCAPDFPTPSTVADYRSYRSALGRAIKELRSLTDPARRPPSAAAPRWISTLNDVHLALEEALTGKNKEAFDAARYDLDRLVTVRPSEVDALLRNAVNNLQLGRLTTAMERICQQMRNSTADQKRLEVLRSSGKDFLDLDERLKRLSDQHQAWQEIDTRLKLAGSMMELGDKNDLGRDWPSVRKQMQSACTGVVDDEVKDVLDSIRELDECLASGNHGELKFAYRSLCTAASNYFFDVDKALLSFCDNIPAVRRPLQDVLRQLSEP
jgi:hypothetical protein